MNRFPEEYFSVSCIGCIDTVIQKILFPKVRTSNSNPIFVGRWYFEYLYKRKILPNYMKIDKGTKSVILSTMHACLSILQTDVLTEDGVCERVTYGPLMSNQVSPFS